MPRQGRPLQRYRIRKSLIAEYEKGHPCFGALTGRVAGRIGNAKFEINGQSLSARCK